MVGSHCLPPSLFSSSRQGWIFYHNKYCNSSYALFSYKQIVIPFNRPFSCFCLCLTQRFHLSRPNFHVVYANFTPTDMCKFIAFSRSQYVCFLIQRVICLSSLFISISGFYYCICFPVFWLFLRRCCDLWLFLSFYS